MGLVEIGLCGVVVRIRVRKSPGWCWNSGKGEFRLSLEL